MFRILLHSLVLLIVSVFSLRAQTPEFCLKPVQVVDATRESWVPGIVRSNDEQAGGTIYRVAVKIKKKGDVTFQSIITEESTLDIEAISDGQRGATGPFKKKEELILVARSNVSTPSPAPNSELLEKLKSRNAAALILFTYRGKQFIRPVNDFEQRPTTQNK